MVGGSQKGLTAPSQSLTDDTRDNDEYDI
ncbi:uncharacterized protein G2W53_020178 [Senna tora]|uniref:Uncharacterized protein n=1 Tax=Senna tora TaxID=362788 RepID=A0A834TW56_9FABA|nr:uncharacterized protein G2W53_020178 [Senna tora]